MATVDLEKSPATSDTGSKINSNTLAFVVPGTVIDNQTVEHDPQDPYNWPTRRKVVIAMILSLGQLVGIMTASIMASALDQISTDLHMSSYLTQMAFSVYALGLGFGPFIIAPMSEVYGRKPVWIACNTWYILWNSVCPVGNSTLMIVARLLAGLGAASGVTLTGPVLADMFHAKDRGKSLAIAGIIPYLGPALGPILGGLVAQHLYWGWFFWIMSMLDTCVVIIGVFVLQETCAPVLQRRKQRSIARKDQQHIATVQPFSKNRFIEIISPIKVAIMRPIRLLLFRPLTFYISFNFGINFAMYFLVLSTFAKLYIDQYDESESSSSLHYIAIALGGVLATQAGGLLMDLLYRYQKARSSGGTEERPEYRVPVMAIGAAIFPAGLLWQGWAAETRAHWAVVDAGAMVFTFSSFLYSQSFYAYLLDEFTHTASANAAVRMFSYVLAFVFPLFATQLYDRLGYGWGNTLLALVFVVLGFPSVIGLWIFGPKLRAWGKEAELD